MQYKTEFRNQPFLLQTLLECQHRKELLVTIATTTWVLICFYSIFTSAGTGVSIEKIEGFTSEQACNDARDKITADLRQGAGSAHLKLSCVPKK